MMDTVTTPQVRAALRERFAPPEYAVFDEVGDGGSGSRVYADSVAVNLWHSRGYAIHGFEIKVSRSDWLRELKQPAKADPVMRYCDFWWLVSPDGVIKDGELPINWGHLIFRKGALRQATKPPHLKPKPASRAFLSSLLRRAGKVDESAINERVHAEIRRVREIMDKSRDADIETRTRRLSEKAKMYDELRAAIGMDSWTPTQEIAAAIQLVMKSGVIGSYDGIAATRNSVKAALERMDKALADANALKGAA